MAFFDSHLQQLKDVISSFNSVRSFKAMVISLLLNPLQGDWWQNSTLPLLTAYEATGIVPVSDSGTVNGAGRFQGGPAVPFAVTNVISGKRYRLRIINQSARNVFTVSIDNHPLSKQ